MCIFVVFENRQSSNHNYPVSQYSTEIALSHMAKEMEAILYFSIFLEIDKVISTDTLRVKNPTEFALSHSVKEIEVIL